MGLFRKLSLWFFNVMNDSLGANFSTLSSIFRVWAKAFASVQSKPCQSAQTRKKLVSMRNANSNGSYHKHPMSDNLSTV